MIPQGHMSEEESRAWIRGANSDTSLRTYGKDRSIDGPGNGGGGFIESRGGIRCVSQPAIESNSGRRLSDGNKIRFT